MKVSAIICEYNPFHNGHKYQIDTARSLTGCDAVVALMSGNFVQRGDFALFPKEVRTKAALIGGVDLVLENPTTFVLRSAEGYASAAVYTLSALGCIDYLVFGTESDDLDLLKSIANLLAFESKDFKNKLTAELSSGSSFASARGRVVGQLLGKTAETALSQPNNLLAIEYLKAIARQGSTLTPVLIKREGADHHSDIPTNNIASASYIRSQFIENPYDALRFTPSALEELYRKSPYFPLDAADKAIISSLCLMSHESIAATCDISEGLENKIKAEAMRCSSLSELADCVKSKRYALSRIRRAILCSYLGITSETAKNMPKYIKIADFNDAGQSVLSAAKRLCTIPLAKNATPLLKDKYAMELWRRELEYDRIYEIFMCNQFKK